MRIGTPIFVAVLLASSIPASAQPASRPSSRVCLNVTDIQRSETPDDKTIIFHMRDGKVWRNTLRTICPMLKTSPFTQKLQSGNLICANEQVIHVASTGSDCVLGDFTPVQAPH